MFLGEIYKSLIHTSTTTITSNSITNPSANTANVTVIFLQQLHLRRALLLLLSLTITTGTTMKVVDYYYYYCH